MMISRQDVCSRQSEIQTISYALHGNCYINLTNRCTLRCTFCPKFNKQWEVKGYTLRLKSEPDVKQVLAAINNLGQYNEIVFCGFGEPTLRLYDMLSIGVYLKHQGAKVRVNTDGLVNAVCQKDITPLLKGCVDSLSVSLNAQNATLYEMHCRPPLENAFNKVLSFVAAARKYVPDITLTAIDGLEGVDIVACEKIANDLDVKFRRRTLGVVG